MEENNNLGLDKGKETSLADEGISIQEESVETHSAEEEAVLEKDAETEDSAVSKTEEKNTDIEESGEVVVKEESEEVKEAEVIEEEKGSDEKEYAEVIEETKVSEEITEEAESEVTEEDSVSDVTDKTENVCETVEPEVEPENEVSKDSAEDADIIEKESTTNTVEEPQNLSASSSKPQAVLDELDKLKSENTADETVKEEKTEESVPLEDSSKTEEVIPDSKGGKLSEKQDLSEEKSEKETSEKQSDSTKDEKAEEISVEEQEDDSSSEGFLLFTQSYNKDFWKSFFFDLFFFCLCACFTFVLIQKWFSTREVIIQGTNQVHGSLESGEKTTIGNINVLVMGIDSVEGTHRSDTIFVLGVNPSKKKIMMLSIPRDTRVIIEDKGRKINEILPRYGEPTLRKILEDLLKIKISRKVEIGFESFISVVDAIGGVDINIEKPMHYDDNWGNLHIHFNPGMNHLNGQDALRYVRFRKDAMADLGRIKRQQDFVKAVIKKLFSPSTIVRVPSIIEKAFKHIKTDFSLQEILTLAKGFDSFDVKFSTMSLPGDARYIDKISFFVPYSEEAIAIGNNYFSDLAILEIEKDCDFGKVIPKQSKSNRKK
jgi:LCP family protein required for cell wall assembly